ncbi:MAG: lamin tail domain-containing protein [bacterium]
MTKRKFTVKILLGIFFVVGTFSNVHAIEPGDVVINELMWMGSDASSYDEWIELKNTTDADIDISGFNITRLSNDSETLMLEVPAGNIIPVQGFFLISNYDDSDSRSNLDINPDLVESSLSLANSKLQVKLYDSGWDSGGVLIDTADDGQGDPLAGDNTLKYSMERRDPPGEGSFSSNWQTASDSVNWKTGSPEKGTPKSANSIDMSPPAAISDLEASRGENYGEVVLTWTAPTENSSGGGSVSYYDIRYCTNTFGETSWDRADIVEVVGEPVPGSPGVSETMTISELIPGLCYYFGIKSTDNEEQVSSVDDKTQTGEQASCVVGGQIPVRITEVSFSSSNDWVELYNFGNRSVDISGFMLTDLDGTDSSFADEYVSMEPGSYVVVHWDEDGTDETDSAGDLNANGYIDLYVADTGLSSTDDELVLMSSDASGEYIDAVCWSNLDGTYNTTDIILLSDNKMWVVSDTSGEADCWNSSENVSADSSLGRKPSLYEDTDTRDDWHIYYTQTPGNKNLFLEISSPLGGDLVEISENVNIEADVPLGEVGSVEYLYRKQGARTWYTIAQTDEEPFNVVWDTTELEMGSYELRMFADGSFYSPSVIITLVGGEEPETFISSFPEARIKHDSAQFEFYGKDNATPRERLTFRYKLDDGGWIDIGNGKEAFFEDLSDGEHVFLVMSRDSSGCEDSTPASYAFTVDTTGPQVNIKAPYNDDKIAGNAVPVTTEYIDLDIDYVSFQYRGIGEDWQEIGSIKEEPFEVFWNVGGLTNLGEYELRLQSADILGNMSSSSVITVKVDFDDPSYGGDQKIIEPAQGGELKTFDGTKIVMPPGSVSGTGPVLMSVIKLKDGIAPQSQAENIKPTGISKRIMLEDGRGFLSQGNCASLAVSYGVYISQAVDEENLRLFYYDEILNEWIIASGSTVDTEKNIVKADITYCGIYQIMEYVPGIKLNSSYIYPNPCYYDSDKRINFSNLPDSTEKIKIYTLSGELVKTIDVDENSVSSVSWGCDNESGGIVASGVYLCLITTPDEKRVIKAAIIK